MAVSVGGTSEYNSEINVTPMVDVMLVLLIIFMIVTPLLQQGVSVNLPRDVVSAEEDGDIAKDTSVIVAIPDNSNFYIGKDQYPLSELGDVIKRRMEGKTPDKRIVYIKSGIDVDYGRVVSAIDTIRKQDIDKVGLVADRKKGTEKAN
ncbi:MAG: biopolymer transporter ExbD [Acidobacteria bacterium]|nr:biopolymer transporter ExbD [Acidobacteriota bacterium]MBK9530043.1 biopolymer transporter ExbD [Acidobacteriota bacterium]MBP7475395.1 biopolymer transporter ExbD [Pyrinomonadaceae bacterium]MBP9110392.1 biopolymer transporter ExbD [Pyrinomonadaceae bacterium]